MTKCLIRKLIVLALTVVAPVARAASSFQPLGVLPGTSTWGSVATGVSGDGLTVIGMGNISGQDWRAVSWKVGERGRDLGTTPNGRRFHPLGVSDDGTTVVGFNELVNISGGRAFWWTPSSGIQDMGAPSGFSENRASHVSGDGQVVVGKVAANGGPWWRWNPASGFETLAGTNHWPNSCSGAGDVVVGVTYSSGMNRAFRWTPALGIQALGVLPGDQQNEARDVSPDGDWVVGYRLSQQGLSRGFRWSSTTGMIDIPNLPGSTGGGPEAVSADGNTLGGASVVAGEERAYVWRAGFGTQDLRAVLMAGGVDLNGWILFRVNDVSSDGLTFVGTAVDPCGLGQVFVARIGGPMLPPIPPCLGDIDRDSVVDFADLNFVLSHFASASKCGDVNGDQLVTFADLNIVLSTFGVHCTN